MSGVQKPLTWEVRIKRSAWAPIRVRETLAQPVHKNSLWMTTRPVEKLIYCRVDKRGLSARLILCELETTLETEQKFC